MKRISIKVLVPILLLFLIASCASRKEIAYFQNLPDALEQLDSVQNNFKIKPNDILSITVTAYDPSAVKPFNLVLESSGGVLAQNQGYLTNILLSPYNNELKSLHNFCLLWPCHLPRIDSYLRRDHIRWK